jgi:hypothetical protein
MAILLFWYLSSILSINSFISSVNELLVGWVELGVVLGGLDEYVSYEINLAYSSDLLTVVP